MKMKHMMSAAALLLSLTAQADPIDLQQARTIASELKVADVEPTLVKLGERDAERSRRLAPAVRATAPYYIFSRGAGMGYIIVSGDDCLPTVLGYTESGDFDEATAPPALMGWLGYYARIIEEAQVAGENVSRKDGRRQQSAPKRAEGKQNIPVLMTTHWHQTWPYNNDCPFLTGTQNRAVTGCVATAAAQVIYYYRKDNPSYITAATPTYGYGDAPVTTSVPAGTPLKWGLMLDSYASGTPQEYVDAVSIFVFAVGAATGLTYGSSTAGQISDLVNTFNRWYDLSSTCIYKNSTPTATWENMIYNDLMAGHPLVYTGYNDAQGGHAVVVDGYQASTNLFHFNFGWGGQGDGWFTVDDETGMNGFISWQGMTYQVTPRRQNLAARIEPADGIYLDKENVVRVKVSNQGTLDYKGVYLFASATDAQPTSLSAATSSDLTTVLPADGSTVELTMAAKPTKAGTCYITLTDKNRNIIAQQAVEVGERDNDLHLQGIEVLASSDTEKHGGEDYTVIYGSSSISVVATVDNRSAFPYKDSPRLQVFVSDDEGVTFTSLIERTATNVVIDPNSTGQMTFSLTTSGNAGIEPGKLYYAVLRNPLTSRSNTYVQNDIEGVDTLVRFVRKDADAMSANLGDDKILTYTGKWNATQFVTLANRNTSAIGYDLTAVEGVGKVQRFDGKPNALYYVASDAAATGVNIVKVGTGESTADAIVLQAGNDFAPRTDIKAAKASLTLNIEPLRWYLVTTPFTAPVPAGMVAKQIDSHSTSGIRNHTTLVTTLNAGCTYLLMTSSADNVTIAAEGNVNVVAAPAENPDPAVVGTYTTMDAPADVYILNDAATQKFVKATAGDIVDAFHGYFTATGVTATFDANSETSMDNAYLKLGTAISEAKAVVDMRSSVMDKTTLAQLLDQIAAAQVVFTTRPYTTTREITDYVTQLQAAVAEAQNHLRTNLQNVELDMTGLLANPSFEEGTVKGWTADGTGVSVRDASNTTYRGVGADGKYLLYSYISSSQTGNGVSQTVDNLTPGVYRLTAQVGTEPEHTVTLFANDKEVEIDAHEFGKYYLTDAVIDDIEIHEGDALTVGIKPGHWYKADNFRLYYLRGFDTDDETAIHHVGNDTRHADTAVYDITGRRVADAWTPQTQLPRGIYIVAGKKIMVR